MTIWKRFDNQYWPADYVADRRGHIRYTHFGEGDYTNTENVIRTLLGVRASSPRAAEVTTPRRRRAERPTPRRTSGSSTRPAQPLIDVQPGSPRLPGALARVASRRRASRGGVITLEPGKTEGRARRQVDRGDRVGHVRRGRRDDPASACTPRRSTS